MTQGKEIEKRDGRNGPCPLPVFQDLTLDRNNVRQDVAMRDEDPFRLGGRSGRKDDLRDIVAPICTEAGYLRTRQARAASTWGGRVYSRRLPQVRRSPRHPMAPGWRVERRYILADDQQLRRNDAADAREKGWRRPVVDRHDDNAVQHASPESDDPFRTVLAPEDDLVAFSQPELIQPRGEAASRLHDLFVGV